MCLGGTGLDSFLGNGFRLRTSVALPESVHANTRSVSILKYLPTTIAKHVTILFLKCNYKGKCKSVSFKAMKPYWRSIFHVSTR